MKRVETTALNVTILLATMGAWLGLYTLLG